MIELYGHPFSSYHQKAAIALYENGTPFALMMLDGEHPENGAVMKSRSPFGKMPLLIDGDVAVFESTPMIEYIARARPGDFNPVPPDIAEEVRLLDRVFDLYVMAPMQKIVGDALRPADTARDPHGVAEARATFDTAYRWLDERLTRRGWAAGDAFTLADCAAAPSLFYADWAHPIPDEHATLKSYRAKALARPSVARCVDEARPYRHFFPLGAPDRD